MFIKFVNPLHLFVCSKSIYEFSMSIYGDFIIISKRNRFLLNVDCSFIFCFSFIGFSMFMKWNNWLFFGNEYELVEPLSSERCCISVSYIHLTYYSELNGFLVDDLPTKLLSFSKHVWWRCVWRANFDSYYQFS